MAEEKDAGRFSDLYNTPLGVKVWAFLNTPEIVGRLLAASDLGKPAVAGLGAREQLIAAFGPEIAVDRWKQTIGHMVRQVMERRGYELVTQGLRISIEEGESLFSKGSRYRRRPPHWGHLRVNGEKPDGGAIYGDLGADSAAHALGLIKGFVRKCAEEEATAGDVRVWPKGSTDDAASSRKVEVSADLGGLIEGHEARLLAALGKNAVAPHLTIRVKVAIVPAATRLQIDRTRAMWERFNTLSEEEVKRLWQDTTG